MTEKVIILFGGLIVTMVVARYLGPEEFGTITFGVTVAGFLVVVSQWGASQSTYILSCTKPRQSARAILYSERIRALIYICLWLVFTIVISHLEELKSNYIIVSLVVIAFLFSGLDIFQFHLNATRRSRVNASETLKGTITSLLMRIVLVCFSAKTVFFVIPYAVQNFITFYGKRKVIIDDAKLTNNKYRSSIIHSFFYRGRRLCMLNAITHSYMKVGAFLIATYIGVEEYSYFNVAYVIAHVWTFIPLAVGTTLLSRAFTIKSEESKHGAIGLILIIMMLVSLPFVVLFYIFSDFIVTITFGVQYLRASSMVFELSIVALLSTIVWLVNRIITYYKGDRFLLKRTLLLSVISIPLNFLMIKEYGVIGVVYSMIIVELCSAIFFNLFFNNGLMAKMFFSSRLRYIREIW